MIDKFLKAKHWQIFILTFGILFVFQLIMMVSMVANFSNETNNAPQIVFSYMRVFMILMFLFMAVFFGWFWSVAIGLQPKMPENVKMNVSLFKVFFFTPLIYIIFFMGYFMDQMTILEKYPMILAIILPLHFFSMFCLFYCINFAAKTLKTVELQRKVTFSDYAGEFFLIWFYPIGIWIIQPRLNKIIEENTHTPNKDS